MVRAVRAARVVIAKGSVLPVVREVPEVGVVEVVVTVDQVDQVDHPEPKADHDAPTTTEQIDASKHN